MTLNLTVEAARCRIYQAPAEFVGLSPVLRGACPQQGP